MQSLLPVPAVVRDTVAGDDSAGAVRTAFAMDKDWVFRFQKYEDLFDLAVCRGNDSLHRYVDILHSGRRHGLGFRRRGVFILPAQIDNGSYSQFSEAGPSFRRGLATAEDMVINLVEIGDARYFDDAQYLARCFDMGWRCGKREG